MVDKRIDNGTPFDWGKTSGDYAVFRDIYPPLFYERLRALGIGVEGQRVLDVGTGTGVLPRNMYKYGAKWVGADISENQIEQARRLSRGTDIDYVVSPAEELCFPEGSFDVITACQCFWYFDHDRAAGRFADMLKENGRLVLLYMAWLPYEDKIAGASEELALKYSPAWSGAGETFHPIDVPKSYFGRFRTGRHEEYRVAVPFTRESWNGRMKTCRGIGASLPPEKIAQWEAEHRALLDAIAPESFEILHYVAVAEMLLEDRGKR